MTKINDFFISIIIFFVGLIPFKLLVFFAPQVGFFLRKILRFRLKIVRKNIRLFYTLRNRTIPINFEKDIYLHFALLVIELLKGASHSNNFYKNNITLCGKENLDKALAKKKGILLLGGHFGNWEYAACKVAQEGYKINCLVKKLRKVNEDKINYFLRGKRGVETIEKGKKGIRKIFQVLKNNEILVFVLDQHAASKEAITVNFCNYKVQCFAAFYDLWNKFNSSIVPVKIARCDDLINHRVEFLEEVELDPDKSKEENMQVCMDVLEELLEDNPSQWIWMHNFWREHE